MLDVLHEEGVYPGEAGTARFSISFDGAQSPLADCMPRIDVYSPTPQRPNEYEVTMQVGNLLCQKSTVVTADPAQEVRRLVKSLAD